MADSHDEDAQPPSWTARPLASGTPLIALAIKDEAEVSPEVAAAVRNLLAVLGSEPDDRAGPEGCANKCWANECTGQGGCNHFR
jgi:hypothetical protein